MIILHFSIQITRENINSNEMKGKEQGKEKGKKPGKKQGKDQYQERDKYKQFKD